MGGDGGAIRFCEQPEDQIPAASKSSMLSILLDFIDTPFACKKPARYLHV